MAWVAPLIAAGGMIGSKLLEKGDGSEEIYRDQLNKLYGVGLPDLQAFNYNPEDYSYQTISEDPSMQLRQSALLDRLSQLGETGLSDADKANYAQGVQQANQAARQRSGALMNEMRARGQGGSGLEYALREQAGQEAMNRQAQLGLAQAGDSARQRALYQQAYGNALAGKRDQDYRTAAANTDIINRFNQLNTAQRNDANLQNMQRKNDVAQQRFSNSINRITGATGTLGNLAQSQAANAASQNALTSGLMGIASQYAMGQAGYGPWAEKEKKQG